MNTITTKAEAHPVPMQLTGHSQSGLASQRTKADNRLKENVNQLNGQYGYVFEFKNPRAYSFTARGDVPSFLCGEDVLRNMVNDRMLSLSLNLRC